MKYLIVIGLCALCSACNDRANSSHQKSYVISKSNQAVEEVSTPLETEVTELQDE